MGGSAAQHRPPTIGTTSRLPILNELRSTNVAFGYSVRFRTPSPLPCKARHGASHGRRQLQTRLGHQSASPHVAHRSSSESNFAWPSIPKNGTEFAVAAAVNPMIRGFGSVDSRSQIGTRDYGLACRQPLPGLPSGSGVVTGTLLPETKSRIPRAAADVVARRRLSGCPLVLGGSASELSCLLFSTARKPVWFQPLLPWDVCLAFLGNNLRSP
jgi:hypothetical protein